MSSSSSCTLAGPPGANGSIVGGLTKTIAASATTPPGPIIEQSYFGFRALTDVVTTDFDAAAWIAPRDGTLVRFSVTVTDYASTDTDPGQFVVFVREPTDPVEAVVASVLEFPTSATTQHQLATFSFPVLAGTRVAVGVGNVTTVDPTFAMDWDSVSASVAFQASS